MVSPPPPPPPFAKRPAAWHGAGVWIAAAARARLHNCHHTNPDSQLAMGYLASARGALQADALPVWRDPQCCLNGTSSGIFKSCRTETVSRLAQNEPATLDIRHNRGSGLRDLSMKSIFDERSGSSRAPKKRILAAVAFVAMASASS